MIAKFKLDKPDDQPLTMTLTMTLREWKNLREQLNSQGYPSWTLVGVINDLVHKAETVLFTETPKDGSL